ncbi:hypothetical protein BGW36DRAFT_299979, partial [Talaromyces proteolyticus]
EPRVERNQHRLGIENDPLHHYVSKLKGWYDESKEVDERHIPNDIMRLIKIIGDTVNI